MPKKITSKEGAVLVGTELRNLWFGYTTDTSGDTVVLKRARQVIYWDASVKGAGGLAVTGPDESCIHPIGHHVDPRWIAALRYDVLSIPSGMDRDCVGLPVGELLHGLEESDHRSVPHEAKIDHALRKQVLNTKAVWNPESSRHSPGRERHRQRRGDRIHQVNIPSRECAQSIKRRHCQVPEPAFQL